MRKAKKPETKQTPALSSPLAGQEDPSIENARGETDSHDGPWLSARLKALREAKNLSQGEIEKRTGLLRCYISRVENGHNVPTVDTLEKLAQALKVPMYQLFYEGIYAPKLPNPRRQKKGGEIAWGNSAKDEKLLEKFRGLLSKMSEKDRRILLFTAQRMARLRAKR